MALYVLVIAPHVLSFALLLRTLQDSRHPSHVGHAGWRWSHEVSQLENIPNGTNSVFSCLDMQYHMPASLLQQEPAGTNMRRLKEIQILVLFSHIIQKRKSLQKLQPQNEI
jgi:hypothetical protein